MLGITKFSSAPDPAEYYLEVIANGKDDYYLASGEVAGVWMGGGSAALGLSGSVDPDDLRSMIDGLDPRTGENLMRWRKIRALDLTLSAPKSVSLLWALGNEETGQVVLDAHDEAVRAAVAYLEDEACVVRRGRGGVNHLAGVGLVTAAFRHRTSREADPNLHTHLLTGNMSRGPDGRWTALYTPRLWHHGRTAGFVYQSVLRHELSSRLDIRFEPVRPGVGEVVGIPKPVRSLFSQRREAIEEAMATHGTRSARGAQIATLDTRPAKPAPSDEASLRAEWHERAAVAGVELQLAHRAGPSIVPDDADLGRLLTDQDSTFDRRLVIRTVAETAEQGLPYDQIQARAESFLTSPEAVPVNGRLWTTPEILALEAEALDWAHNGRRVFAVPEEFAHRAIAQRPSLSQEQAEAVEHITMTDAPVAVVVGHAGAGKTFALDAARSAFQQAGLRPIGAALSAKAAKGLETGSGIPSATIASVLRDLDTGHRVFSDRTVVLVDEAGMVGTRQLHRLSKETTKVGAKLVLVGDPKQLAEIEAGGLFAALGQQLGAPELTENRRLRSPNQHATAAALREGNVDEALHRLRRGGSLTTDDNADRLRTAMTEDWFNEQQAGRHAVMLALHRSDVADLNRRARGHFKRQGLLDERVLLTEGIEFSVGDRVLALRNDRRIGIQNGTQAVIRGREGNTLHLETDDGTRIDLPAYYAVLGDLTHGYAMTVHKSQGMTCDVSLVLGDDSLYAEAGYTSITRGRDRNHVYAVEPPDALDQSFGLSDALRRSAAKQTATEQMGLGL